MRLQIMPRILDKGENATVTSTEPEPSTIWFRLPYCGDKGD